MIAIAGALGAVANASAMGLHSGEASLDLESLQKRITGIENRLEVQGRSLLDSQGVRIIEGFGTLLDPHTIEARTADHSEDLSADAELISTGSTPRPRGGSSA